MAGLQERGTQEDEGRGLGGFARRIDAQTPQERDRYLDFLRVVAIILVILGHWIVRVILGDEDGLHAEYLLDIRPPWQWATLIVQVMPVFFLVGGLVNASSWRRARNEGEAPTDWISRRARRLLFPLIVFFAVMCLAAIIVNLGPGQEVLILSLDVALIPLWFLAVYLLVICATPVTLALHERGGSPVLIAGFVTLAFMADIVRFVIGGPVIGGQPAVGSVNFVLIWVAIHQIGYLWGDDRLPRSRAGQWALLVAAGAVLTLLIGAGFYPLTMVPVEGTADANNAAPPTVALFMLALVQLAIALLLRRPMTRRLRRPGLWAPVAIAGPQLINLFIWHQAVMLAMVHVIYPLGLIPVTSEVDAVWWLSRPLWVLWCFVPLVLVVLVMRSFEKPPEEAEPAHRAPWAIGAGLMLFTGGIAALVVRNFHQETMPLGLPWAALVVTATGMFALGAIRRGDVTRSRRR